MKSPATVLLVASISLAVSGTLVLAQAMGTAMTDGHVAAAGGTGGMGGDAAQGEWARVAAQIRQSADLAAIIQLQQKYLEKYPDAAMARDVAESLANYQKLADAGGVKYHDQWMTADQRDVAVAQADEAAKPAVEAYLAGKIGEARDAADALLAKDPQNAPALAIAGLTAYRAGNLVLARKQFAAILEVDREYLLAQNNLAVIGSRQKQTGEMLLHYTKALGAAAAREADATGGAAHDELTLLNNVAEAMNTYKAAGGNVASANFHGMATAYAALEATAETAMAKVGMQRQGSGWVSREQADAAAKNHQALHDQMTLLEAQYQTTGTAISNMEAALRQADAQYDSAVNLSNGNAARAGWAKGNLQAQHDVLVSRLADLSGQSQALKSQLAAADSPFTGEQAIIDIDESIEPGDGAKPDAAAIAGATLLLPAAVVALPTPVIFQPGADGRPAGSTVSPVDADQEPPADYGGVYNPPSVLVNAPQSPKSPAPAVAPHVDHCVPRRDLFVNGKLVDLRKLAPPGSEIVAHGDKLYTPEGVITLDDQNTDFSEENGVWDIGQNGSVIFHDSAEPIVGPSGPWTLNPNGVAVRQSRVVAPSGPWVLNAQGQAVRSK